MVSDEDDYLGELEMEGEVGRGERGKWKLVGRWVGLGDLYIRKEGRR